MEEQIYRDIACELCEKVIVQDLTTDVPSIDKNPSVTLINQTVSTNLHHKNLISNPSYTP